MNKVRSTTFHACDQCRQKFLARPTFSFVYLSASIINLENSNVTGFIYFSFHSHVKNIPISDKSHAYPVYFVDSHVHIKILKRSAVQRGRRRQFYSPSKLTPQKKQLARPSQNILYLLSQIPAIILSLLHGNTCSKMYPGHQQSRFHFHVLD